MTIVPILSLGGLAALAVCVQPASLTVEPSGAIRRVGTLRTARAAHTATTLPSGEVLVAGGMATGGGGLATAELFDPADKPSQSAG